MIVGSQIKRSKNANVRKKEQAIEVLLFFANLVFAATNCRDCG